MYDIGFAASIATVCSFAQIIQIYTCAYLHVAHWTVVHDCILVSTAIVAEILSSLHIKSEYSVVEKQ